MALDTVNAIGAFVILNNKKAVDTRQKVLGVAGAALLPGLLGLTVPLIIAQKAASSDAGGGSGGSTSNAAQVAVPDLTGDPDDAKGTLKALGLTASTKSVTSVPKMQNQVIEHTPKAGSLVKPGSNVTLVIGAGPPEQAGQTDAEQAEEAAVAAVEAEAGAKDAAQAAEDAAKQALQAADDAKQAAQALKAALAAQQGQTPS